MSLHGIAGEVCRQASARQRFVPSCGSLLLTMDGVPASPLGVARHCYENTSTRESQLRRCSCPGPHSSTVCPEAEHRRDIVAYLANPPISRSASAKDTIGRMPSVFMRRSVKPSHTAGMSCPSKPRNRIERRPIGRTLQDVSTGAPHHGKRSSRAGNRNPHHFLRAGALGWSSRTGSCGAKNVGLRTSYTY